MEKEGCEGRRGLTPGTGRTVSQSTGFRLHKAALFRLGDENDEVHIIDWVHKNELVD
jgi:hypothetical protein